MNVVTRGTKNALRSPIRSGAIVLMLAISIALVLVMLAARSSVTAKINEVKAATATTINVSAAGIQGGQGGGDPLTTTQITSIKNTPHVTNVVSTLTDQLGTSDTNLTPSATLGAFGQRQQRFEGSTTITEQPPAGEGRNSGSSSTTTRTPPSPRTTVTGTTDVNSVSTNGGSLSLISGSAINTAGSANEALVGTNLATKNNLSVGSSFTAYGQTITVKGIYKTGSNFADNGLIMPLATVQTLTNQAGDVVSATVSVDSSENVSSTVTALKNTLGDKADVTSASDRAASSLEPLQNIGNLTLVGVFGAAGAGAVIMLLAMIMIVRERRREIGVIKAIGGNNFKVIAQFIIEAITLTFMGAIIGIAIGIFASGPLTKTLVTTSEASSTSSSQSRGFGGGPGGALREARTNLNAITGDLSLTVFASAMGVTFLIAIIGSALPAWLIARVRPAEVLRTE